ncbi:MAG: hypothetical protein J5764_02500 [Bacteroidales bacterium]|nr:hypothetical protein [Bacteroidales bacterium]
MKQIFITLSIAALALASVWSCSSNGIPEGKAGSRVGEIYLTAQSGAKTVLVTMDGLWRVIPQNDWITVDVKGREGEGAFTFYYSSNESDFVSTNPTRRGAIVIRSLTTMVSDTLCVIQQGTPDGKEYTSAPQDSYIEFVDASLTRMEVVYANLQGCGDISVAAGWINSGDAQIYCLIWENSSLGQLKEALADKFESTLSGNLMIANRSGFSLSDVQSGDAPSRLSCKIDGISWQVADFDPQATALPQLVALLESGYNQPYSNSAWVIGGSFYYYSVMEAGYPDTPSWYPSDPSDNAFLADIYAQTNNLTDCIWMARRQFNPTWSADGKSWRADYVYVSNKVWNTAVDVRLLDAPVSGASHKAVRLTVKY